MGANFILVVFSGCFIVGLSSGLRVKRQTITAVTSDPSETSVPLEQKIEVQFSGESAPLVQAIQVQQVPPVPLERDVERASAPATEGASTVAKLASSAFQTVVQTTNAGGNTTLSLDDRRRQLGRQMKLLRRQQKLLRLQAKKASKANARAAQRNRKLLRKQQRLERLRRKKLLKQRRKALLAY